VTAGGAAFWLADSRNDEDSCSSSFERNRGYMTKAEPLLFYEGGSTSLHDDRPPRFGHHTTVIAGGKQQQQQPPPPAIKETTVVATSTTNAAATAGVVKPHTVRFHNIHPRSLP
jgi:hypothetical protein